MSRLYKIISLFFALSLMPKLINSQVSLSVVGSLSITPSNTVTNGTNITVQCNVKNNGSITITGPIALKMAIDISTTATPNYVFRAVSYSNVNGFAPNSTVNLSVSDIAANYNQYKTINGGPTVVVVWPIYNNDNSTIGDSATKDVYVYLTNNVNDMNEFETQILKIQNPIHENVYLDYDESVFNTVELINSEGKMIQLINEKLLNIQSLSNGLYYLNFHNHKTKRIVTKKIVIE